MNSSRQPDPWMKRLVYLYFFLLIFEGALRKWVVPSLSAPLLLVRDPVLLAIYAMALSRGIWPSNGWVTWTAALCILCVAASLAAGCPLFVSLYGARTDFLQIPFIFLMPSILEGEDVRRIGKWMLFFVIPMAILALLQFRAAPEHWLNATTGKLPGEQDTQLFATSGKVRPAGTFSFVTGMVSFLALATAYIFGSFLSEKPSSRLRLGAATVAVVLALGISGSRSAILSAGIVAVAGLLICIRQPAKFKVLFAPIFMAVLAFFLLKHLSDFRAGLNVNRDRFSDAGGLQRGILSRWFGDVIYAGEAITASPLLGSGLGLGTNVGAQLTTGARQFLLAESEWARAIMESGPLLGVAFIALRISIAFHLFGRAMRALNTWREPLPALLFAASAADLMLGQWGQPTISGFATFTSGLSLAAALSRDHPGEEPAIPQEPRPAVLRGRSIYAESIPTRKDSAPG